MTVARAAHECYLTALQDEVAVAKKVWLANLTSNGGGHSAIPVRCDPDREIRLLVTAKPSSGLGQLAFEATIAPNTSENFHQMKRTRRLLLWKPRRAFVLLD